MLSHLGLDLNLQFPVQLASALPSLMKVIQTQHGLRHLIDFALTLFNILLSYQLNVSVLSC